MTGFEPATFCVTGRRRRPLFYIPLAGERQGGAGFRGSLDQDTGRDFLSALDSMASISITVDDSGNYHVAVDGEMLETVRMVKIRASDSLAVPRCTVEYFPTGTSGGRTKALLAKVPWVRAVELGMDVPESKEDEDLDIER